MTGRATGGRNGRWPTRAGAAGYHWPMLANHPSTSESNSPMTNGTTRDRTRSPGQRKSAGPRGHYKTTRTLQDDGADIQAGALLTVSHFTQEANKHALVSASHFTQEANKHGLVSASHFTQETLAHTLPDNAATSRTY